MELHEDVVIYARQKLDEFLLESPALDMMDFALPSFVVGNCLLVDPVVCFGNYDRVYCGASVPEEHVAFIRGLIKVGGIAVLPCGDQVPSNIPYLHSFIRNRC